MTQEVLQVDDRQLARLVSALKSETNSQDLNRDLVRHLRDVAIPARDAARAAILSAPSRSTVVPAIRPAIARNTQVSIHTAGDHPGVAVRVGKTGMPRGFADAAKKFNANSWRHPVFGRDRWVTQVGAPGWFDKTMALFRDAANHAAGVAMDEMANRIDYKTKG